MRGDMLNKCPNIRVLQGPIYTRAKIRVYADLVNYVLYASTKCAFLREWLFVYDSNENYSKHRQYGGSGEMACLVLSAI